MTKHRHSRLKPPAELKARLAGYRCRHVWDGYVTDVFRCQKLDGNSALYLKRYRRRSWQNGLKEEQVLVWLRDKLPVAEVVAFDSDRYYHYLLLKELQGVPAHKLIRKIPEKRMLELMVKAMLQMHAVPIQNCPFDETMPAKLVRLRFLLDKGWLRKDTYNSKSLRSAEQDYRYLCEHLSVQEEVIFTHGDFCLPNILLTDEKITGFVDLADAGPGDRYMDICTLANTMCYNYNQPDKFNYYCQNIFELYGINDPDWEKLQYYRLVNEMV